MPAYLRTMGTVVVVTAEDGRFQGALRRAIALATGRGEPLILYDWDAPSLLGEPLPDPWSRAGADDIPSRLDPEQLDAAGRGVIADQVRAARSSGVEAYGWLPSDHGPASLAACATAEHASMIVVPRDLTELGGLDAIVNGSARPVEELEHEVAAALVVV
jgi:hypothetical protein